MDTLKYILDKYNLKRLPSERPVEIPNMGRNNLAELFRELGFTVGAEIGTMTGEYAEDLCRFNPNLLLHCVDPWELYPEYTDIRKQNNMTSYYEQAVDRLVGHFNCNLIRKYSVDAVKDFDDESLDFVYIDANHDYLHVVEDICYWQRKVKRGGILAGHDFRKYLDQEDCHVVEAVSGYVSAYRIDPWFVLGRKQKRRGEIRDRYRSWMFINNGMYHRHDPTEAMNAD